VPNCDFYAVGTDLTLVLDFVFEESGCRVFESYSTYGQELHEFRSSAEVGARNQLGVCAGTGSSVSLELLAENSGKMILRRVTLDPSSCEGHTFRYRASGWGLIQLQLGGSSPKGILHSHTNHNTLKRAMSWEPTYREVLGSALEWDWPLIERTSRRINSFIRKTAAEKLGSRPVLPEAAAAIRGGVNAV
jgi:hypothetical protein